MNITTITTRAGARPARKRRGRGPGSGLGKTAGKGHKGQNARSGGYKDRGLLSEGGVFPLFRRLPKVGFNNYNFQRRYQVVNLDDLEERFDAGARVTAASLEEAGLIPDRKSPVKILGDGKLSKSLTIEAERFSISAASKIEAAGGTVKRLGPQPKKKFIKRSPATGKAGKPAGDAGGEPAEGKKKKSRKGGDEAAADGAPEGKAKAKGKPKDEGASE